MSTAFFEKQKKSDQKMTAGNERDRQRAVFAGAGPTIVAAGVLNFCVRYEYRCVHSAIITGSLPWESASQNQITARLPQIKSSID